MLKKNPLGRMRRIFPIRDRLTHIHMKKILWRRNEKKKHFVMIKRNWKKRIRLQMRMRNKMEQEGGNVQDTKIGGD